jgi:hypothetical protein
MKISMKIQQHLKSFGGLSDRKLSLKETNVFDDIVTGKIIF